MTTQAQKKAGAAIAMLTAIIGALMMAGQIPEWAHRFASASQTVLAVITLWLPRVIGDSPAEVTVQEPDATKEGNP